MNYTDDTDIFIVLFCGLVFFIFLANVIIWNSPKNSFEITKENPTIEDYVEANYTFYIDGNKVKYPDKLIINHYTISMIDDKKHEIILEKIE